MGGGEEIQEANIRLRVIWREIRKVRVEVETEYGSDNPMEMVGQYLWGTLQTHRVMDEFLQTQFRQHPEVDPHITLYLFKHRAPQVEVSALKQRVEAQSKALNKMEKTCKELRDRFYSLTDKANKLIKK